MKIKKYLTAVLGWMAVGLAGACTQADAGKMEEERRIQQEALKEEREQEEKVDLYLEELEKLNQAVKEIVEAGQELAELGQTSPEAVEEMTACVERMRTWKQTFSDFSREAEPPEGFWEAHRKMAEATGQYGDLIDAYCDVLLADIQGEESPDREQILSAWEEGNRAVAEAMGEVREAAGYPAF